MSGDRGRLRERPTSGAPDAPTTRSGRSPAQSWAAIRLVAGLELRQRIRTSRWYLVLAVWVIAVYGVVLLGWFATSESTSDERGVVLYSMTTFVVLGFGLLVVPALTATSINGDRDRGVLATLQVTQLGPAELVLGKLLAAWALAGLFLLVAAPVYVFTLVTGAVGPLRALGALLVLAVCLAVFCAVGLACSAWTARTVSSVVLTYLAVAGLGLVTVILFGLLLPRTAVETDRQVWTMTDDQGQRCVLQTQRREDLHTERVWWLLAPNPFVVVADAAPALPANENQTAFDPLQAISTGVRLARIGPAEGALDECWSELPVLREGEAVEDATRVAQAGPVWPLGLGALVLLGVGSTAVAIRRTRTPVHRLPRDVRIA
ncbi:ABC transporter permease [Agilicoccus flavus]|uniref:ABC transporter permease n=1 Tax=Agilicoccus flavus TaxID=2775968 RepID=UPI001CF6159F|nr:ABC transporter permease subunit [Agilicoccus flavus]